MKLNVDTVAIGAILFLVAIVVFVMFQYLNTTPPQIDTRFDSQRGIICYIYGDKAMDCMTDPLAERNRTDE